MMILVIRVLLCAYLLVLLTIFGVSTKMKYIAIFAMFVATYAL